MTQASGGDVALPNPPKPGLKHTPGPWRIVTAYTWDHFIYDIRGPLYQDNSSLLIAEMSSIDERNQNAKLIIAAPEMLAALKRVREFWPGSADNHIYSVRKIIEQVDAAICKAEGEL